VNSATNEVTRRSSGASLAFFAAFSAWTFDAFDFFILTYIVPHIAQEFHRSVTDVTATLTATLVMRPVGALLFGLIADRWGRRIPLMVDVLFYSLMEVLSGFAPTYRIFFMLRLLYGVGMGGAWGVGASLAMESVPTKWRGLLSGVLQEGYAVGNLLAAVAFWTVFPHWGWRPMFFLGVAPALITLGMLFRVQESESWKATAAQRKSWREYLGVVAEHWRLFLYLVLLMAMMNFMSHGTQDLYPTFLQLGRHFGTQATAVVSVISMVGAIIGGIVVGLYSDHYGRRRAMAASTILAIFLIPLWIFAPTIALISLGAFLIQFLVQGAWGVIPAHINELSPGETRGFLPGFAYQVGVLIAASTPRFESATATRFGYAMTMSVFAATVFIVGAIVIAAGPEAHRKEF
jgi:SHS family lactate transporter-like MFS transporter